MVKVSNESFTRIPTIIDEGGNWVASSSGDVKFGNGKDDVRRMKFTTKIDYSNNKYKKPNMLRTLKTIYNPKQSWKQQMEW